MDDVNKSLIRSRNGSLALQPNVKESLVLHANCPNKVARMLAGKLFTTMERVNGNVTGKRSLNQLDPVRLLLLKQTVFEVCGVPYAEQPKAYKAIKLAVDAANRQVRFNQFKLLENPSTRMSLES